MDKLCITCARHAAHRLYTQKKARKVCGSNLNLIFPEKGVRNVSQALLVRRKSFKSKPACGLRGWWPETHQPSPRASARVDTFHHSRPRRRPPAYITFTTAALEAFSRVWRRSGADNITLGLWFLGGGEGKRCQKINGGHIKHGTITEGLQSY